MSKITIVDGNNEIELSTAPKENIKFYMVKGEAGSDGVSPTITASRSGTVTTLTMTDKNGTTVADINDGFSPTVDASKQNRVTTLSVTDYQGTETVEINDGIDLTGGVPTNGVIGWDDDNIFYSCDGTETGTYYLTYNTVSYYFTMPTVTEGDILLFNTTDLELSLNGTTISTSSSGTGTQLTFNEYIPNGYEATTEIQEKLVSGTNIKTINNTSILGSGNINIGGANVNNSYSTSTTEPYSANYINGLTVYSTSETICGYEEETVNNQTVFVPRYRKKYTGTMSGTSNLTIPHGLTNYVLKEVKGVEINTATGTSFNLPSIRPAYPDYTMGIYVSSTNIIIEVTTGAPDRTGQTVEVILEYIKTS